MSPRDRAPSARAWGIGVLIAVVATTVTALWIATGDAAIALVPLAVVVGAWACLRSPPHVLGVALLFVAIVLDNPKEHPALGDWQSPLYPLGVAMYENLNTITGVEALRFSVMDVLLAGAAIGALSRHAGTRGDVLPVPRPLRVALVVVLAALLAIEAWGMLRGGDFKNSLWQLRQLIWLPGITWVFASTVRGPKDLRAIGVVILAAAAIKVAFGAYFYWVICKPKGILPDYVTTHSDSVLFVTAIAVAIAAWLERPTRRAAAVALATLVVVGIGVVINGRRLAYIGLSGSILTMALLMPKGPLRARLARTLLWAGGPIAAYVRLGWHSHASIFLPAEKIASLFSDSDRSAGTRDVENYNLVLAWKKNVVLGSGFGHPYDEYSKGDSIERFFGLYRFIGHDSVLWLYSVGGLAGFAAIWSVVVVGAYFAARAYRVATDPTSRSAALVALCVAVAFIVQAYGDMGMQSWVGVFLLGMALAVAGKLAVAAGAWPAPALVWRQPW